MQTSHLPESSARPLTALITGANRGLGFETARLFLQQGHHVVLAGRDIEALDRARHELDPSGEHTRTLVLDMACAASIAKVPDELAAAGIQLDVLVNNAGIFPRDAEPVAGLRQALDTNVTGAVALTLALAEHLLRASQPRVVMVSSGLGSFARCAGVGAPLADSNFLAYQTSKAALNMATVCLAKQFAGTALVITAISPGWCRTDMGGTDAPRSAEEGAAVIYQAAKLPAGAQSGTFLGEDGVMPW